MDEQTLKKYDAVMNIRREMYESYLKIARVAKTTPLTFSEWMVKRNFGYDPIDKCWVYC